MAGIGVDDVPGGIGTGFLVGEAKEKFFLELLFGLFFANFGHWLVFDRLNQLIFGSQIGWLIGWLREEEWFRLVGFLVCLED